MMKMKYWKELWMMVLRREEPTLIEAEVNKLRTRLTRCPQSLTHPIPASWLRRSKHLMAVRIVTVRSNAIGKAWSIVKGKDQF